LLAWGGGKIQTMLHLFNHMPWWRGRDIVPFYYTLLSFPARLRNPNVTNRQMYIMSSVNKGCLYGKQGDIPFLWRARTNRLCIFWLRACGTTRRLEEYCRAYNYTIKLLSSITTQHAWDDTVMKSLSRLV
jgi:hypothetical protein